jgi:hypothetical protein
MKIIELKLSELLTLESEINGIRNLDTGEILIKGFINHKLPLIDKYKLNPLSEFLQSEKEKLIKVKEDLLNQYGILDDNGQKHIPVYIESINDLGETIKTPNDNFIKINKEFSLLLNETIKIEYNPIRLELLSQVETEENYHYLYKLIDIESND